MKTAFSILWGILLLWTAPKTPAQSFWKPCGTPTVPLANHSAMIYLPSAHTLLISTYNAGIFKSIDQGNTWQHVLDLPKDQPIFSLYATRQGTVLAGGYGKVYVSRTSGEKWEQVAVDSADGRKLVEDDQGAVYLGSLGRGVLRSTDQGRSWKDCNNGLPNRLVNELASDGQGHLFCGVVDEDGRGVGGVYYWDKTLGEWQQKPINIRLDGADRPLRVDYINAMAVSAEGRLYVSATGTVANFSVSGLFSNSLSGAIEQAAWQQEAQDNDQAKPFVTVLDQLYFTSSGHQFGNRISTTSPGIYTNMTYHPRWSQQEGGIRPVTQARAHFCELPDGSLLLTTQYSNQLYLTRESQPGKRVQTLAFDSIPPMRLYEESLLSAHSSSGLPVRFRSLNSDQAYLTGNRLRAVGLGRAGVKAYLDGNDSLYYAEEIRRFSIDKARNVIDLTPIPDLVEGGSGVSLRAMASSGLEAEINIVKGPARIVERRLIPQGPGRIDLIATEEGNATYAPADTVSVHVCVLPLKPTITVVNDGGPEGWRLISSRETGNRWFRNGIPLPDEGQLMIPRESGQYALRIDAEGCLSAFSDEVSILITGLEGDAFQRTLKVYPNPFQERLSIEQTTLERKEELLVTLTDAYGRMAISQQLMRQAMEQLNTAMLPSGLYLLKVESGQRVATFKVIKQPRAEP